MDMTLSRLQYRDDGIFSELLDFMGNHFCYVLEHAYPVNGSGFQPKLMAGDYACARGMHSLHSNPKAFETFEVTGVQGHTGILFHVGNFNNDSDGCLLLGDKIVPGAPQIVSNSITTFAKFMELQDGVSEFMLTVIA